MAGNDAFDIRGRAVTELNCVTIEYLAVFFILDLCADILISTGKVPLYRVAQINPHKFQMVGNTYTKRNSNISFTHVIVYIHSS